MVEPPRLRVPRHVGQRALEPHEGQLLLVWLWLRLAVLLQRRRPWLLLRRRGGPLLEAGGQRAPLSARGRGGGGRGGQGALAGRGLGRLRHGVVCISDDA